MANVTRKLVRNRGHKVIFSCTSNKVCKNAFIAFSVTVDIEDQDNWHGKPIPKDRAAELIAELENQFQASSKLIQPDLPNEDAAPADLSPIHLPSPPEYKLGDKVIGTRVTAFALFVLLFYN